MFSKSHEVTIHRILDAISREFIMHITWNYYALKCIFDAISREFIMHITSNYHAYCISRQIDKFRNLTAVNCGFVWDWEKNCSSFIYYWRWFKGRIAFFASNIYIGKLTHLKYSFQCIHSISFIFKKPYYFQTIFFPTGIHFS